MNKKITVLLGTVLIAVSCHNENSSNHPADVLASNIDTTARPADDFFEYAVGNWKKHTEIPQAESSWGIANLVQEEIYVRLRKINEEAADEHSTVGVKQQIGDFWISGMDSVAIDKAGLTPLSKDFESINALKNVDDLLTLTASFHVRGIPVLFGSFVAQDDKNSEAYAFQFYQSGLGMPNRDYYFNTDERTIGVRKAYQTWLQKTFMQLGDDSVIAAKNGAAVFTLETKLAKASRKLADLRDPYKNYNKMSVGGLSKLAPLIKWDSYLHNIHIKKLDSVIVGQPEFYTALNKELKLTKLADWKNYMRAHLVGSSSTYLDKETYLNYFNYRKSLTGSIEPRPRWKQVLDAEEDAMGEALGQIFVKEYFDETAKKRYTDLVENIRDAYKDRIKNLTWMTDSTKQMAYKKLASIKKKVGFPEKWKDFSALKIDRGPFVLNMQRANAWWHNYEINKLGKPVNRDEWNMTPQTWNAYYNPSNNEIVLPAGIFAVPGMKDADLDDAFVYGYAGASTIGHEITHGFDDQGRQYDEKGNLHEWWQPADATQFKQRANFIINQYNGYNPVDTLHINGNATQGENIADLGGVLLGLDAFKKTGAYKSGKKISGLTPLQRYFLGYSYSWMFKQRKERLANQVMTDVHSPAKQRVNGPLVNIPEFYQAFGIKPGDKMFRADSLRVRIW